MDYDSLIASYQQRAKIADQVAVGAGASHELGLGATSALFHIAMQLAQLNKNLEALTAAKATK